jgi:signal transduction histidine kinase
LYSAVVLSEWDFMTISGFKNLSGQAPSAIWVDFSLWYELLSILWMALMQVGTIVLSVMVLGQRERYHARLFQMYQQLDQQLAALRQLDRLKNSFLSTVSHELRTPLTILQGCQELLGEQNGVSQTAEYYIEESRKATALLAKRVNLMLAYTTLASGEETLVYDDFNPGELFQYVTSQQQGNLMRARMTLHCAASPSVGFYGDRAWLTEALNQLVLNAIQAGAPGGRIWLDASADADCDRLLVSDDGPGLPPAIRQQFGEPFAQVDWRLTEHAPGLGLGLAFAKLVSLAHRGQLGFRDRPQGGTVIIMSLPHKSPATTGTLHPNALPSS